MTKTIEPVSGLPSSKELKRLQREQEKHELGSKQSSRASSASPPLVLKYLETLPPEREVTLLVEVVEGHCNQKVELPKAAENCQKAPKVIAELPVPETSVTSVASIVKAEIKEESFDEDLEEISDKEEECFRIIEETVVDVSTLPGRTILLLKYHQSWSLISFRSDNSNDSETPDPLHCKCLQGITGTLQGRPCIKYSLCMYTDNPCTFSGKFCRNYREPL